MESATGRVCEWMMEPTSQAEPLGAVKPDWLTVVTFSTYELITWCFIVFPGGRWEHRVLEATDFEQVKPRFICRLKKKKNLSQQREC